MASSDRKNRKQKKTPIHRTRAEWKSASYTKRQQQQQRVSGPRPQSPQTLLSCTLPSSDSARSNASLFGFCFCGSFRSLLARLVWGEREDREVVWSGLGQHTHARTTITIWLLCGICLHVIRYGIGMDWTTKWLVMSGHNDPLGC